MGLNLAFGIFVAFIFIFFDKVFGTLAEQARIFTLACGANSERSLWYYGPISTAECQTLMVL